MPRRVMIIDRSALAKNVYSMILSKIGEVESVVCEIDACAAELRTNAKHFDLVIISASSIENKKKEIGQTIKNLSKESEIKCVVFVRQGMKDTWAGFEKTKGVHLLERPFFPDDLLNAVKRLWGIK